MTPANVNPIVKQPSIAAGTNVNAASNSAPKPIPARPPRTRVVLATRSDRRRTTGIPSIMPVPTIALTIPNVPALACSPSRT